MAIPNITITFNAPTAHDTTEDIENKSYTLFNQLNPWTQQLNAYANAIHTTVRGIAVTSVIDYRTEIRQIRDQAVHAKNQAQEIAQGNQDTFLLATLEMMAKNLLDNLRQEKQINLLINGVT